MPELPEVEHARRTLTEWLVGARITSAFVYDTRILDAGASAKSVEKGLADQRVVAVERRGKWLRIVLDAGRVFSHLGMTGKWVLAKPSEGPVRFEKIRLDVVARRAKRSVRYIDPRLFGRFVVAEGDAPDLSAWDTLGPDPLTDGIDVDAFHRKLLARKIAVKAALLDQTVLAGVGNIQATEALFFARIDPRRPSRDLTRREVSTLAREIRASIDRTLALQEGPEIQYVEESGAENPFTIYGREETPCPRCKRPLTKMILGGRGTVYCARCQR